MRVVLNQAYLKEAYGSFLIKLRKEIQLNSKKIESIENNAFEKLSRIERVVLEENVISKIGSTVIFNILYYQNSSNYV